MADQEKERSYFGIPRAMGLGFLKSFNRSLGETTQEMLHPKKPTQRESFEEAMIRLELTEEDIKKRTQAFLKLMLLFTFLSFIMFVYAIFLFWENHFTAGIIGLVLTAMMLTQVFRYHFWHFQMKKRKLGCSIKEWLKS